MRNLDELLTKKMEEVKIPNNVHIDVREIEERGINKNYFKSLKYIAAIILFFVLVITFSLTENKNLNITAENNSSDLNSKQYIIYSSENMDSLDSRVEISIEELFELSSDIAIVSINDTYATNYDVRYEAHYNGEMGYTFVRTISDATIKNILKGNIESEQLTFRKKGGKIQYLEYKKYFEANTLISMSNEVITQYEESIEKGINISDIYVDESVGFKNYNLEIGKEYLVFLTKKNNGLYWAEGSVNSVMEYNAKSNMLYDKINNEWISLDNYIN